MAKTIKILDAVDLTTLPDNYNVEATYDKITGEIAYYSIVTISGNITNIRKLINATTRIFEPKNRSGIDYFLKEDVDLISQMSIDGIVEIIE